MHNEKDGVRVQLLLLEHQLIYLGVSDNCSP